ncbi:MAG: hypothetical protein JWL65_2700 [Gammaproteobacteria bacterium]|nr:hypothetical protein [Gammaproteobacteria bacterium]
MRAASGTSCGWCFREYLPSAAGGILIGGRVKVPQ